MPSLKLLNKINEYYGDMKRRGWRFPAACLP